MKAVYIREFGSFDNIELREVPDPKAPAEGEVLLHVKAAGLNRADLLQARGLYPPPAGYSPNIPGLEFAGEIAGCGPDVSGFSIGDRVFGIAAGEAQAEYLIARADALMKVPDRLTFTEAACVPEAFITAHDAVIMQAGLQSGEMLLVHAVGSGVGLAALQIAKARGAIVIGTSRTEEKLERCREYGLDAGLVIDDPTSFADQVLEASGGRHADVILDLVGGAYFEENLKCLALKGRLMLVGLTSGRTAQFDLGLALTKRARITGTVLRSRTDAEKAAATQAFASDILPLLENGTVRPTLDRVFNASDAAAAYDYLASNESFGKVCLEMS